MVPASLELSKKAFGSAALVAAALHRYDQLFLVPVARFGVPVFLTVLPAYVDNGVGCARPIHWGELAFVSVYRDAAIGRKAREGFG